MAEEERLIGAKALWEYVKTTPISASTRTTIMCLLDTAPTVDAVKVVHGWWIKKQLLGCEPFYLCSVCGKLHDQDYNFCNNCGAKMDGGGNG